MGAGSSAPKVDYTGAQFSASDVARQIKEQATKASTGAWGTAKIIIWSLIVLGVLLGIMFVIWYFFFRPPYQQTLDIQLAAYKGIDYTESLRAKVGVDSVYVAKGFSELNGVTLPAAGGTYGNVDAIVYKFSDDPAPTTASITSINEEIDISLANREAFSNKKIKNVKTHPAKTFFGSLFGSVSGNQLPYSKDATSYSVIPSGSAPLADGGDYGMQFWMYIKDWNTNFGKEKHVLSRSDSSNSQIMNPSITLHPTENTLKVSISVFPSSTSSKAQPDPAGYSGVNDDVFICEVPDIPLQSWISVSVTVFSRNLDIYINGKLVKSCLLSGVPKKAIGDISMNKDGGFSGYVCGFYHYPRMLVPSDAQAFYSAGHSCSVPGESALTKATGYGVRFGLYDASGKVVNQYVF